MTTDRPTRLVTYAHRLKRAATAEAEGTARGDQRPAQRRDQEAESRAGQEREIGPAAQARVQAFLQKMIPNRPLLQDD
jgi:hypothetical protein